MDRLTFSGHDDLKHLSRLSTPVWIFDVERHFIWWANDQGLAFWKASSVETLRQRDFSSDSGTVRERLQQIVDLATSNTHVTDTWTLYPTGQPQTTILSFQPVEIQDQRQGVMIELVQIVDRDADDETWRLLEAARTTSLLMTTFSTDGRLLAQNPAALACYGAVQKRSETANLEHRFVDPSNAVRVLECVTSNSYQSWEAKVITAKGVRTHFLTVQKGRDPITGDFVAVLSEEDVTEQIKQRRRQQSEKEALQVEVAESSDKLRISQERYELAVQTAAIWDWDIIEDKVFMSPNFINALEYSREEFTQILRKENVVGVVHPNDRTLYRQKLEEHLKKPETALNLELRAMTKTGKIIWYHLQGKCVRDADGQATRSAGLLTDITPRKKLEASLLVAQRMEAIGQLTGGIAHDFNNLLTVIQGNAELLEETAGIDLDLTSEIVSAVQRGADLTTHLLAFAKQQTLIPATVDLNTLIPRMKKTLLRAISETVEIIYEPTDDLWDVFADPTQIETAILNLAFNARDAMPTGGKIEIKCRNWNTGDITHGEELELTQDAYVEIAVIDTGMGMSEETIGKAFEPFFTTKKFGKGSGLGLSMVLGFSRQSNGDARIQSSKAKGTAVSLFLPKADGNSMPTTMTKDARVRLGNREHVHILEDNIHVKETVERMVKSLGYTVSTSHDAFQAIEVAEENSDIDLFLVDVILPGGKSGVDFALNLRELRPNAKVLLMSGYPETELLKNDELNFNFVSKPFDKSTISKALERALS